MQRIRNWPRWLRFGLLSASVALTLSVIGMQLENDLWMILGGSYGLPLFLSIILSLVIPDHPLQRHIYVLITIFWFLIGGLLGRFVMDTRIAVGIWVGIQILSVAMLYSLVTILS